MKTSWIGMMVLAGVVVAAATNGWAASDPTKVSRACRKSIASSFGKVASTSLGVIAKCHGTRDKGKFTGDCNDLAQADLKAKVAGAEGKATAAIAKKCPAGEPVLRNYPSNDPNGGVLSGRDVVAPDDEHLAARVARPRRRQGESEVPCGDREGRGHGHQRDPEGRDQVSEQRGQARRVVRRAGLRRHAASRRARRARRRFKKPAATSRSPGRTSAAATRFRPA